MLMAAVRLNIPSIVVSGGPMLSGRQGTRHVSLSQMFEAVGSYKAGIIGEDVLDDYTKNTCPGCGSCSGMYTANSMNCLCEAIGMALPGNGTIPAVYAARTQLAKHAGMRIMDLVRDGCVPGYSDAGGIQKCTGHGYGAGLQFQQRFAPSGHCQRGGCAYEPGDFQ